MWSSCKHAHTVCLVRDLIRAASALASGRRYSGRTDADEGASRDSDERLVGCVVGGSCRCRKACRAASLQRFLGCASFHVGYNIAA
jgi:hypothetical protein